MPSEKSPLGEESSRTHSTQPASSGLDALKELHSSLDSFLSELRSLSLFLSSDSGSAHLPGKTGVSPQWIEKLWLIRQAIEDAHRQSLIDSYLQETNGVSEGDWTDGLRQDVSRAYRAFELVVKIVRIPPEKQFPGDHACSDMHPRNFLITHRSRYNPGRSRPGASSPKPITKSLEEIQRRLVARCEFLSNQIADASEFVFRRDGGFFFIKGFGEQGLIAAKYLGVQQIYRLIQSPNEPVSMLDLLRIDETSNQNTAGGLQSNLADSGLRVKMTFSAQKAIGKEELIAILKVIAELEEKKTAAELTGNESEIATTQYQIDELEKNLAANTSVKGKGRKVRNIKDALDLFRSTILDRLATAREEFRNAGLNNVAAHFKKCIKTSAPDVTYFPQRDPQLERLPDWVVGNR